MCINELPKTAIIDGTFCTLEGVNMRADNQVTYSYEDIDGTCFASCTCEQWDEGIELHNGYNLMVSDMHPTMTKTIEVMLKTGYEWHQLVALLAIIYPKPLSQVINLKKKPVVKEHTQTWKPMNAVLVQP